jgi:DNA-binding MarR family transcriptional regulator
MNGFPEQSPLFQLMGTLQAVHDRIEDVLEPIGLSLAKFGVLARLVSAGEPLPLGALAERCACVRSNITQLVDRLEADKLVLRAPDPCDRRSIRAELTLEGRRLYERARGVLDAAEQEVLACLAESQREELLHLLRPLRRGL